MCDRTLKPDLEALFRKAQSGAPRLIRLYSNRRLYDTIAHRYIIYRDLKKLVETDVDFLILDVRRGVDHTDRILLDVMLQCAATQHSAEKNVVVPDGLLRQLIVLGTMLPKAAVREFLDESIRNFTRAHRKESNSRSAQPTTTRESR